MAREHNNKPAGRAAAAAEPLEDELLSGIAGGAAGYAALTPEEEAAAEAEFRSRPGPRLTYQDILAGMVRRRAKTGRG